MYGSDGLVAQSVISSGQSGYRTPTGVFSVIQKNRYHQSNIYSGAPMPWMHRITWSGIALHGGVVPGYPASHGCIRLTYDFAPRLWAMSRMGMRVIVAPQDLTPEPISHPRLPAPTMTTVPATASARDRPVRLEVAAENTSELATLTDRSPIVPTAAVAAERAQNPLERARAARTKAIADAAAAEKAVKPAVELAQRSAAEANAASAAVRRSEAAVVAAERRLAAADRAAETAKSPDGVDVAVKAQEAARQSLDAARQTVAEAKAVEAKELDESFAAATAAKRALASKEDAAEAVRSLVHALEPISVFVSRKEGRIFLRQGFNPLFDEAVTIRDPEQPLGTHVLTVMASEDGGASLRWTAVTVPDAGSRDISAAQALDRIEIPKEVRDEIANRLWAGASLIISDRGIGTETGKGTDFIVLTKY